MTGSTPPMAQKDPITCHVLDTITGRPAANLQVSLTLLQPLGPSAPWHSTTDDDGRIANWRPMPGPTLHEIFDNISEENGGGQMVWALKFDTGKYFGEGKTFFPEVEIRFFVRGRQEHYHVPLLLGPWNYTTYRGYRSLSRFDLAIIDILKLVGKVETQRGVSEKYENLWGQHVSILQRGRPSLSEANEDVSQLHLCTNNVPLSSPDGIFTTYPTSLYQK
ncbi:MAG: hypothetical protein M1835_002573 [Candelina submexicana]|nr:MAG: hypothetical protein M1835_002573 [Candelina submexicana]